MEDCIWEWDGNEWEQKTGPLGCHTPPPPISHLPPGSQTTNSCGIGEDDDDADESLNLIGHTVQPCCNGSCEPTTVTLT